jgi:hypothetical protein
MACQDERTKVAQRCRDVEMAGPRSGSNMVGEGNCAIRNDEGKC